jgi:ribosomal protein L37E
VAGRQLDASPWNRSLTSGSGDACAGSLTRGSRRQLRDVVSQKDFGDRSEERGTDHHRMATSAGMKITLNRFSGVALLGIAYSIAVALPTADVATCRPRQRRDTTASFAKSASSESNVRCRRCGQFCFAHASDLLSHWRVAPGRWPRAHRRRHGSQEAHLFGVQMGMAWTRRPCVGHFRHLAVLRIDQLSAACSRQGPPRLPERTAARCHG